MSMHSHAASYFHHQVQGFCMPIIVLCLTSRESILRCCYRTAHDTSWNRWAQPASEQLPMMTYTTAHDMCREEPIPLPTTTSIVSSQLRCCADSVSCPLFVLWACSATTNFILHGERSIVTHILKHPTRSQPSLFTHRGGSIHHE